MLNSLRPSFSMKQFLCVAPFALTTLKSALTIDLNMKLKDEEICSIDSLTKSWIRERCYTLNPGALRTSESLW